MTEILNPFIVLNLYSRVVLSPSQLNERMYDNIKNNLIANIEGKCNEDGCVTDIYKIIEYKKGLVNTENYSGSIIFDITFLGRVCVPIRSRQIICLVKNITSTIITCQNGPIRGSINIENINQTNFTLDQSLNVRYKLNGQYQVLSKNKDFVKVTILGIKFNVGDTFIIISGNLDQIASKEEIEKYYDDLYETPDKSFGIKKTFI